MKKLTFEQDEMLGNIYDRACDFPNKTFEECARETLGEAEFAKLKADPLFESELRKSFELARV